MNPDRNRRSDPITLGLVLACVGAAVAMPAAHAQNSFGDAPRTSPAQRPGPVAQPPSAPTVTDARDASERQELGVAPKHELHAGAMHGPTPASIPGGQIITTQGLLELRRGTQSSPLVFDVLGGPEVMLGARMAVPAHRPGSFDDATQREFGQFLQQATQGRKDTPLVFYCQSVHCWMSYNAALRAIRLGYTRVMWYRGGIEAWKRAGQPVQAAGAAR